VWGDDSHGQLGLELQTSKNDENAQENFYTLPKSCSFNVLIKEMSCGQAHTAMLTMSGYLYMMGSNQYGQLGVGMAQNTQN
jgi:X-linked retinitis pigmentosa GTPase regulator